MWPIIEVANCRCEVQNGVGELSKTVSLDVQGNTGSVSTGLQRDKEVDFCSNIVKTLIFYLNSLHSVNMDP